MGIKFNEKEKTLMASIEQIISCLKEKRIDVHKVISRKELMKRLSESIQNQLDIEVRRIK